MKLSQNLLQKCVVLNYGWVQEHRKMQDVPWWIIMSVCVLYVCLSLSDPCGLRPPPVSWSLPSGGWCFLCWLLVCLSALWSPGWFSSLQLPFSLWSSAPAHWLHKQEGMHLAITAASHLKKGTVGEIHTYTFITDRVFLGWYQLPGNQQS